MPRHHSISLMCDDLRATMDELSARGATFSTDPVDRGFGVVVFMAVPGADDVMLYEPHHATAHDLAAI
ncbi:VOC family protein [Knoellia sp. CPCC 206450]|uniref:VOC family protein n=1 Tax=Knoellia tibetensis TaxID=3404798 RepID=UPI003B43B700